MAGPRSSRHRPKGRHQWVEQQGEHDPASCGGSGESVRFTRAGGGPSPSTRSEHRSTPGAPDNRRRVFIERDEGSRDRDALGGQGHGRFDFREWRQDKPAIVQLGMRQYQRRVASMMLAEPEQIDVQWAVGEAGRGVAPGGQFERLGNGEHHFGAPSLVERADQGGVQERRAGVAGAAALVDSDAVVERRDPGCSHHAGQRQCRSAQRDLARARVGAEREGHALGRDGRGQVSVARSPGGLMAQSTARMRLLARFRFGLHVGSALRADGGAFSQIVELGSTGAGPLRSEGRFFRHGIHSRGQRCPQVCSRRKHEPALQGRRERSTGLKKLSRKTPDILGLGMSGERTVALLVVRAHRYHGET